MAPHPSSPVKRSISSPKVSSPQRPSLRVADLRQPGKLTVCKATDRALGTADAVGKGVVEGGLMSITGSLNRSHTEPYIRSQPHGWHACRYKNEVEYAQHLDRTRKDAIHRNPSMTSHAKVKDTNWAGGGSNRNHGAPDHAPGAKLARYNPFHHQWYHTVTRMRSSPIVGPSTADVTRKARDHIGYGDGSVGYGDVQGTAVSDMVPSWFVGVRMVPGPYGVPRCPAVDVEDGELKINNRRYKKGPNLSIIETDSFPGQPSYSPKKQFETPRFNDWREYQRNVQNGFKCVHGLKICDRSPCDDKRVDCRSKMTAGGCIVQQSYYPRADLVTLDPPFIHRTPTEKKTEK